MSEADEHIADRVRHLYIKDEYEEIPLIHIPDDDDDDDDEDDSDEEDESPTEAETQLGAQPTASTPPEHARLQSYKLTNGQLLRPGKSVEVFDGQFMRVAYIYQDNDGVKLQGIRLRRAGWADGMLERKCNELYAVLSDVNRNNTNPKLDSHLAELPVWYVKRVRRVIFSNLPFAYGKAPDHSFRDTLDSYNNWEEVRETAVLVCRWKLVEYMPLLGRKPNKGALIRLHETEADPGRSIPDAALTYWWLFLEALGIPPSALPLGKETGGDDEVDTDLREYKRTRTTTVHEKEISSRHGTLKRRSTTVDEVETVLSHASITKTSSRTRGQSQSPSQPPELLDKLFAEPYPYGDIGSGAGGTSCGAKNIGFKLAFGLDHWREACETLKLNCLGMKVLEMDIHDFSTREPDRRRYRVVVLHISFPCQSYSPANTRGGNAKNDAENEATGYSAIEMLRKTRPRVVTLEQTRGLCTHHRQSFYALVHQMTAANYSIGWEIISCADYGHVQARKRLICIASCPGEPLPSIPRPRNDPKTTIANCLARCPPLRDIETHMRKYTEKSGARYDANKLLKYAITCSGGKSDLHPSGKRGFMAQELAQLVGWPASWRFVDTTIGKLKKMMGNAVPPETAKDIFQEVTVSLRKGDRAMQAWLKGVSEDELSVQGQEVIDLVEEEEREVINLEEDGELPKKMEQALIVLDDDDVIIIDD